MPMQAEETGSVESSPVNETEVAAAAVVQVATLTEADTAQPIEQPAQQVEREVQQAEVAIEPAENALPAAGSRAPAMAASKESTVLQKALDQAASSKALGTLTSSDLSLSADYNQWLSAKLRESREWLSNADRDNVSIQVLMRSKSAAKELVHYLRNEWPLDLNKTYLYEVSTENRSIYRVFYSEYDSLSAGRSQLELLPESVKINSPYLHSVYRMQKALL